MTFYTMDALQCFTFISENVPSWITRVSDLAVHTAQKHNEFSEEYKNLTHIRPRRRKNSSVHSIRPASELKVEYRRTEAAKSSCRDNQGSLNATRSEGSTGSRRQKGPDGSTSTVSGDGTQTLRARRNLVIHYDGHTQKELEQVVRDIGMARNSIRKGKMLQMMRKPALSLEAFSSRFSSRDASKSAQPSTPGSSFSGRTMRGIQKESSFDFTDKQLELAQSLCESAAHQFLRCGECSMELDNIQDKFNLVLETASNEVERLRAENEQEREQDLEQNLEQNREVDKEAGIATPQLQAGKPVSFAQDGKPPEPGAAAIEVDDSVSESSVSIDITAFRSSRFRA